MGSRETADVVALDDARRRRDGGEEAVPAGSVGAERAAMADVDAAEVESAGDMLRVARVALGKSLDDVAGDLNVTASRIDLVERMETAALPAAPFVLGFVRSYANLLDLPADALVARYRREAGYPERTVAPKIEPKTGEGLGPPVQVSLLSVLIIICFGAWLVWRVLDVTAPEDAAPPPGSPLASAPRTPTGVTYEVGTSLEDDAGITPNLGRETGIPAAGPVELPDAEETAEIRVADTVPSEPTSIETTPAEAAEAPSSAPVSEPSLEAALVDAGNGLDPASLSEEAAEDTGAAVEETPVQPAESLADRLTREANERVAARAQASEPAILEPLTAPEAEDLAARPVVAAPAAAVNDDPIVVRVEEQIRFTVEPVYPRRCESSADEVESVTVSFTVSRFGKVMNPEVTNTTNDCFNRAALAALTRWDFSPATENGQPVTSDLRSTRVVFRAP